MRDPWDPSHYRPTIEGATRTARTAEAWSAQCRAWCAELARDKPEQTLRTHIPCERCGFMFVVRTSRWSMGSDSDVYNEGTCLEPDCKHAWQECS